MPKDSNLKAQIVEELRKNGEMTSAEVSEAIGATIREVCGALKSLRLANRVEKRRPALHEPCLWKLR